MLGENEGKGPGENKIILSVCTLIDHTNNKSTSMQEFRQSWLS